MRRFSYLSTATAITLTGGILVAPHAAAADRTVSTIIPLTCQAVPSKLVGPQDFSAEEEGVTVDITAPETVNVGDEFETQVTIQPVDLSLDRLPSIATMKNVSRIKLDIAIPQGLTILEESLDSRDSNLEGFVIKRIDEQGNEDPTGRFLRIVSADNATIGNGPNSSRTVPGGVTYVVTGRNIKMTFPILTLKFRADEVGVSQFGVRSAGDASVYGTDENFLTMLAQISAPFVGTIWAPTRCTPRVDKDSPMAPQAIALSSVTVKNTGNATATELSLNAPSAQAGAAATVTATISPSTASGTVNFTSNGMTRTVPIANGVATTSMIFPDVGDYDVTAVFTPNQSTAYSPSTSTTQIKVSGQRTELSLFAPDTARASSSIPVTATVAAANAGTVTFTLGDTTPVSAPVRNGRATASLPVPATIGSNTITAEFVPPANSVFTTASKQSPLTIADDATTIVTLAGPQRSVRPGETVPIAASVVPVEGTTEAAGTIVFTADGADITVPVTNNHAEFAFTPDRDGVFPLTAVFTPTDDTQTKASSQLVVIATTISTEISVTAPPIITTGQPADIAIAITPAVDGTVTAHFEGRSTSAPVSGGVATVPLTFERVGTHDVVIDFTPEAQSTASTTSTTFTAKVNAPSYSSATLTIDAAKTVKADTPLSMTIAVEPNTGSADQVSGSLTFNVDGESLKGADGQPVTMPLSRGKATIDLSFTYGGKHQVTVQFTDNNGVTATGSHEVTVSGGKVSPTTTSIPGTSTPDQSIGVSLGSSSHPLSSGTHPLSSGTHPLSSGTNPLSSGSSTSTASTVGPLGSVMSVFAPLFTWLQKLLAILFGGSSS